jgi:L-2,4-diaminobutyrate decarboxylase
MAIKEQNFLKQYFLTSSPESQINYQDATHATLKMLVNHFATLNQAYSGKAIPELKMALNAFWEPGKINRSLPELIEQIGPQLIQHLININHPLCMAHLNCPPLLSSIAAEIIISTTNQSMDTWDGSAAATLIEQQMVDWLCQCYGFSEAADGIFTSGGTQSNLMGLLLARDYAAHQQFNWSISKQGLPPQAHKFRILCSADSHFSIRQASHLLGLGEQALVPIATNDNHGLSAAMVKQAFYKLKQAGLLPIALVSTAGTTDLGTISPLDALADCAKQLGIWFHVDAAFGSGLIFSEQHRHKLAGIEQADSLTIDFHKLFYQSISCGVFLVKNKKNFDFIQFNADYLNPESNEKYGLPDLVGKSIQTTRRFDALKIYLTLQAYGQEIFATLIDTTLDLAQQTAAYLEKATDFELLASPVLNTVVFRYCPTPIPAEDNQDHYYDSLNEHIRYTLLQTGQAIIGRTKIKDQVYLKFTLMNPLININDIDKLFTLIRQIATQKTDFS